MARSDVDVFAALLGEPPTDQESIQSLAQALRKQAMLGQIGMMTGDKGLAPVGQSLTAQAMNAPQQVGAARDRQAQREATDVWRTTQIADRGAARGDQMARLLTTLESREGTNDANNVLKLALAELTRGRTEDRGAREREKTLDSAVFKYGGIVNKSSLSQVVDVTRRLNDAVTPYIENNKPLPGVGGMYNVPVVGAAARATMSDKERAEATDISGLRQQLHNLMAHLMSGTAVTGNELERRQLEEAMKWFQSDEEFRLNWPNIVRRVNAGVRAIRGSATPEVQQKFVDNMAAQGDVVDLSDITVPVPSKGEKAPQPQQAAKQELSAAESAALDGLFNK